MQRPKGNDVRRATFDGPPELAAFFRKGRLETIPAGRDGRQVLLAHADHAMLRRHLIDAGLLQRDRGIYRRA